MCKRIVLAGLSDFENYGDQFIGKCVEYLVRTQGDVYETVHLNLVQKKKNFRFLIYGGIKLLANCVPDKNLSNKLTYIAMKFYLKKYYFNSLKTADALIFACGSFKYGTQRLWCQYSIAVECAERLNIPIMFDAMNIQKYDAKDWRCLCLKEHANRSCVKMITSRDGQAGVDRLREYYITNLNITLLPVGDPAFWIPECYEPQESKGKKIGINLIRGNIYKDYKWRNISEDEMIIAYVDLIKILNENGVEWELFTNGLPEDYEFGCRVLEKYGCEDMVSSIKVPSNDKELVRIISRYKGVVGGRLHACICAYALDIPVVGFVWDEKIIRFAEMTDMKEYFCDDEGLQGKVLFQKLQSAMDRGTNKALKQMWKQCTKDSITDFLQLI